MIPCCTHRHGVQYAAGADSRAFGNVFEKSLAEIWNSELYRQARHFVSNPVRAATEARSAAHFCDACPALFETTVDQNRRRGSEARFEELYIINERGRPARKPGLLTRRSGETQRP